MTDQDPNQTTPPGGAPYADEPIPEADPATGGQGAGETASAKGREWLAQLETMINDIATQAAPVARQVAAKAAELTAVAAVKAGPLAQKAAEVTTDAGQKLAERAQTLAAELRGEQPGTPAEDVPWADTASAPAGDPGSDAPEATFEDATDSTSDTAGTASFESGASDDEQTSSTL
ncbi:MAG TPA: hypothetical protein VFY23_09075 [Candidatus Limnocylindrales bacterium]|nr:hypothetical protein [Candidatus Limnocylindrales bacterium]